MKIKKITTIVFIALLIAALPLILVQLSKQQEIRQRASTLEESVKFQTSITPASISSPGEQVSFEIDLINTPLPKNITGIDMQITYDSNYLAFYNFYPTLANAKLAQAQQPGSLRYLWIDPGKVSDNSQTIRLGSIVFLAKQEGVRKETKPIVNVSNITVTALGEQDSLKGSQPDGSFELVSKDILPTYNKVGIYEIAKEMQLTPTPMQTQTQRTTPTPTSDTLLSISITPTPTPSPAPFLSEVFPKEGTIGTMFTISVKAPPQKNINAKVKIPIQGSKGSYSITFDLNDTGVAAEDDLHNYNAVINTSSGDFAKNGVFEISYYEYLRYPDGKWDVVDFENKDFFTVTVKDPNICTAIVKNGESDKKIDVLFIANNYKENELESFGKDEIPKQMNAIFSREPFSLNKDKFNIFFVKKTPSIECSLKNASQCITDIRDIAYKNCPFFDRIIAIDKKDYRQYADLGSADTPVALGTPKNTDITVHEFGHAMGFLGDEYDMTHDDDNPRDPTKDDFDSFGYFGNSDANCSAFACPQWCSGKSNLEKPKCPGFADKKTCQDHRYNGVSCIWLSDSKECDYPYDEKGKINFGQSCEQDSACYYGCGWGRNKYRPSVNSIMNKYYASGGKEFNAVSKKLIQKAINLYTK